LAKGGGAGDPTWRKNGLVRARIPGSFRSRDFSGRRLELRTVQKVHKINKDSRLGEEK